MLDGRGAIEYQLPVRFSKLIACCMCLQLFGGHWLALQSLAWTTMFAGSLGTKSVAAALKSTFDGQDPCALCKAVKKGRSEEQQSQKLILKTEAVLLPLAQPHRPVAGRWRYPLGNQRGEQRWLQPPIPPPRALS